MSGTMGTMYTFGEWQFDTRLYELRCAEKILKLEPKVFDVLLYLIEHRDRVISSQELMEHLWPGQFIGDAALVRCVVAARRAIGDRGRVQRCIKTLRNRGYRFVAPVEELIDALPEEEAQVAPLPSPPPRQQAAPLLAEGVYSPQTMLPEGPRPCPQVSTRTVCRRASAGRVEPV